MDSVSPTSVEAVTPSRSVTVAEALRGFDGFVAARKKSGTRKKYMQQLRHFERWAGDREPGSITLGEVEMIYLPSWEAEWLADASRNPEAIPLSDATRRNRIQALRAFYRYCERLGLLAGAPNPMTSVECPSVEKRVHDWLRPEQDRDVLDATATEQERALVFTLRFTGLRVSEVVALTWGSNGIDLAGGRVRVEKSKTPKGRRVIPILPELLPVLKAWRTHLESEGVYRDDGAVFPILGASAANRGAKRRGDAISPQYAHRLVSKVGKRAGLSKLGPHALRRTFASNLINPTSSNKPVRLEVVSRLLGHSSTRVTEQSYAELLDETIISEVLEAFAV